MKYYYLKLFIVFVYLISSTSAYSIDQPIFKNIVIHEEPKKINNIEFMDADNNLFRLNDFNNNLVILNFWATWCAPCREEMPSLDKLDGNNLFNNLQIIPINISNETKTKSGDFFKEIKIENLKIYYDENLEIPKKLFLRGLPTTILINKSGNEFARIIGAIDFQDSNFIKWLKQYD
tara:strand:+ start:44 stop:574 length:531 start_codon:yes stop_codon:yes gene_type:complete